ncbi:patatin-like phospholipase family protein [Aureimonas pseudogalii]|uniref:Putative acylesterase/phospholipase RssA n=1 Tax=Aureimonas pseudogalii TaxID=1744844 RepID=A0A7W6E9K9_9HYPH|nr:patatin-like phospholipase family protein [Aureimonas pseudogalii]MBB3997270.1 putative acylesterase/phospholipase RssA [Aureimonas pseudogalii]
MLAAKVDFEHLNAGPCRYTATAVDLETGDDVVFDSSERRIEADHVRASAALPVLFPPVEIDGRWLIDGGVSANLALDPFFASPPVRPTLCLAADLLPRAQALPRTLTEAACRMQDLIFAAQSRRSLARWRESYASHREPSLTLATLTYAEQGAEVVGKALDFSSGTLDARWRKGRETVEAFLRLVREDGVALDGPGLQIVER